MQTELRVITSSEAAARLRVHPKTVSRLVRQGRISGIKMANRWLIDEAAFEEFERRYVAKVGRPLGYSPKKGRER